MGREAAVSHIGQHREIVLSVVWTVSMFLSVFRHDYTVAFFLSYSIMIIQWPCLILVFHEVFYVQPNTVLFCFVLRQNLALLPGWSAMA